MECYVRGCTQQARSEIDLHIGGDTMIVVLLCQRHYRQAWDAKQIGWWGGSGVDR